MTYEAFISAKQHQVWPEGIGQTLPAHPSLFPFQKDIVLWALRRGAAAVFADTGLGKTMMELEFARQIVHGGHGRVLILTPLAVAQQTIAMAQQHQTVVPKYCTTQADVEDGVTITNYERLENFDPSAFDGVILDESSILKSFDGKTRNLLIEMFRTA